MIDLAAHLREWREELGWSQARAAEELGVGLRTYHGWEAGESPQHQRLVLLATRTLSETRD